MYSDRELTRLALHKAALRHRIAMQRTQCVEAAARVAQPLAWLDRVVAFWHRLSPYAQFAAVPLGFLAQRAVFPRRRILGSLLRWGPLVVGAVRGIRTALKARGAVSPSAGNEG